MELQPKQNDCHEEGLFFGCGIQGRLLLRGISKQGKGILGNGEGVREKMVPWGGIAYSWYRRHLSWLDKVSQLTGAAEVQEIRRDWMSSHSSLAWTPSRAFILFSSMDGSEGRLRAKHAYPLKFRPHHCVFLVNLDPFFSTQTSTFLSRREQAPWLGMAVGSLYSAGKSFQMKLLRKKPYSFCLEGLYIPLLISPMKNASNYLPASIICNSSESTIQPR